MGAVILYGGLIMLLNLIADILYAMLDPRVRYDMTDAAAPGRRTPTC